jgi:hypothetical protein
LRSSFVDVASTADNPAGDRPRVVGYSHESTEAAGEGIFPCDLGVLVRVGNCSALVSDRVTEGHFHWMSTCQSHILVVGERWQPSAADWIALHSRGTSMVICSKIAPQLPVEREADESNPDATVPDYLCDLNRLGSVQVSLAD